MNHRYAIYFCPRPETLWWARGSQWLGRCAASLRAMQVPLVQGLTQQTYIQLTNDPRRYGWHATLKAPFTLATGYSEQDLRGAVQSLAARFTAFDLPALQVRDLGHFLALVPQEASAPLDAIARACVTQLHPFAQALSDAELARRRKSKLSPQEDAMLVQWGYPFVLDTFRFHCSLTGSLAILSDAQRQAVVDAANDWFAGLAAPRFDSLALVAEPSPGADFVVLDHMDLSG